MSVNLGFKRFKKEQNQLYIPEFNHPIKILLTYSTSTIKKKIQISLENMCTVMYCTMQILTAGFYTARKHFHLG